MADIEIRRFERADERREFAHGTFELVSLGAVTVGRASYEPGWVWSEHVGKPAGQEHAEGMTGRDDLLAWVRSTLLFG